MSLVIAFSGTRGGVIAGDMREIFFSGSDAATRALEQELYTGRIITDEGLNQRACQLGVSLAIRDTKCKVGEQDGILTGEVSESDGSRKKIRRLYVSAGHYAIAEIEGASYNLRKRGEGSSFVVLGNEFCKEIAFSVIREHWKDGGLPEAIRLIILIMELAASRTASVSRTYHLLQTGKRTGLDRIIHQDREMRENCERSQ